MKFIITFFIGGCFGLFLSTGGWFELTDYRLYCVIIGVAIVIRILFYRAFKKRIISPKG